jgi:hypothetical protein
LKEGAVLPRVSVRMYVFMLIHRHECEHERDHKCEQR